jgi:TRAP transporter TAXI family solute receptor
MRFLKLLIAFLLLLAIPTAYVYFDKGAHKKEISIATGGKSGGYYAFAQQYKKILEKDGINLKIVTTSGSIDAQQKVIDGEVDYAFVQGGTEIEDEGLKALANIAYEPIWIFHSDKNITSINELIGRNIAIGVKGSGIYPVATNLLGEVGIDVNNSEFLSLNNEDASFGLQAKTIDAMFYVASPNSKLVKKLLSNDEISLLHFANAQTYKQYFLNKNQNFQILTLQPSGFSLKDSIPDREHKLLAVNTLLITKNAPQEITRLFMKVMDKVHSGAGIFKKEGTFPNASMLGFEQDEASIEYFKEKSHFYEENFDFWTAQSLNKLHNFALLYLLPLLTIFAFFVEVIIPTIEWIHRRKIIKWYDKINALDTGIEHLSPEEARQKKRVLEQLLHEVRNQDDIPPTHMEEFYTLQNQIVNIMNDVQKKIYEL